jgi:RNase H-fold protein (predicted Holliday junction resolvase)
MAARSSITNFLTAPSKVAHALDWRKVSGSILSMTVGKDRIDLAVASHPSFDDPILQLPSILLENETRKNRKVLKPSVVKELSTIVQDFNVCGMVVSWPVQSEGWCGAQCGHVLHTLDQLAGHSLLNNSRPICLWDEEHNLPSEDEWGRAAIYSRTTNKTFHQASEEQYESHNQVALDVWNDFCRAHWPELWLQQQQHQKQESFPWEEGKDRMPTSLADLSWLDCAKDGPKLNQALL